MRSMLRTIASSPINALLVMAPVSWFLAATAGESPWLFITAASVFTNWRLQYVTVAAVVRRASTLRAPGQALAAQGSATASTMAIQ